MLAISSAQDFHAAVAAATEKPLVACFSAPWCGGCKLVAPKVEALAQELAESATFCKVGADELETLCEEVEVDSFPHFRMYKEGKILGDYTSSKFDKVDTFIRGLVAPDTVKKTEETPEGETPKEEEATETEEGSKKRPEREEMASNDEQVAKKAKTEEEEVAETPKEDEKPVETEQVHTEAVENEATSEEAVEKEATSEEAVEKEATSEEAVEKEATSEEAVEKEETAPADADAAAA